MTGSRITTSGTALPRAARGQKLLRAILALLPWAALVSVLPSARPGLEGQTLVATGQILRPAGEAVSFGGRPVDLVLSPDGRTLYVKDNRGVVVVDAVTWRICQELPFPAGGGSMHGIVASRDGTRVYATTAQDQLYEASAADGDPQSGARTLAWTRAIRLPGPGGKDDSHACGLALAPDPDPRAYVCLSRNNSLGVVDLKTGRLIREIPVGVAPWDVALSPDGRTAFVSDWGGRHPGKSDRKANSSGTDALVDERGIAASGAVSVVDLVAGRDVAQVETGLHPSSLALSADGKTLFAANANSDTISVIDARTHRMRESILVRPDPSLPFGSAPTGLALSPDGGTLWVALGGSNAVAVVALGGAETARRARASQVIGLIPAGWYPGAVVSDGKRLFIANVKGTGAQNRPVDTKGFNTLQHLGTVSRVPLPSAAELRRYTAQVRADARVPEILRGRERAALGQRPVPVPERVGEPSVFEHVVYIIKENRTYDQVFGDLTQGNGDPSLCIFGRDVTPNQHALAEQFVLLDRFYCNGVLSADGHCWATEGNVTDHLEKSFGGFTRSYTWGDDPLTYSSSGFLWDNALRHGLSVRNYGEMDYAEPVPSDGFQAIYRDYRAKTGKHTFRQNIGIARLRALGCREFPGWNLSIPDVLRAEIFLKELKGYEERRVWPHLVILFLGNDHTSGTSPGYPTPRAQVADNDLALGRIVEGITKSRFWPKTCLFVVEDDPQNGFDHVDGHRSPALVISPYTQRAAVIHQFYNQTAVLHTIEQILALPPMNQFDALAPLMRECFTDKPDFRPYTSQPNRIALDEMNPPVMALHGKEREWATKSLAMDFQRADEADDDTLNRILWHSVRGVDAAYPARLAGAHGP